MYRVKQTIFILIMHILLLSWSTVYSEDNAEVQKDLSKPSKEHEELAKYAGKWNVEMQFASSQKDEAYSGTSINTMLVENRFLQIQFAASKASEEVSGVFIIGFDRRNLEYQMTGMDTWGTYYVSATGKRLPECNTIKLYGKDNDPNMKKIGFDKEFGYSCTFENENMFVIDVFFIDTRTAARNELKFMEYRFSRTE